MAIASPAATPSLSSLTTRQNENGPVPLGLRGAISLGSGLRAGLVLAENVDRIAAELNDARAAAAEATREAQRAEAELQTAQTEEDRANTAEAGRLAGAPINASEFALDEEAAANLIAQAQRAGEEGAEAARGTFVDVAV